MILMSYRQQEAMVEQQELVIVTTNFQKFPHLLNYIPNNSLDINVRKELCHKRSYGITPIIA